MASSAGAAGDAWVTRVLGVSIPGVGGAVDFVSARDAWTDAIEQIDAQISALQSALRKSGDEDLAEIAEFGLNAVTGNHKVRLMAALRDIGAGPASPSAAAKAVAVITPFRAHIASDERVAVCDENPFGVSVSIRATLGPALAGLERALAA